MFWLVFWEAYYLLFVMLRVKHDYQCCSVGSMEALVKAVVPKRSYMLVKCEDGLLACAPQ